MKKIILSSASLIAMTVGGFALADTTATNAPSMPTMEMKMQNPAVEKAIEAKDFTAFISAVQGTPLSVIDTTSEFEAMLAMKQKMTSMQEKMKAVHSELGLPTMMNHDSSTKESMDSSMHTEIMAVKKAIEANDFAAFTKAAAGTDFAVVNTQEKFAKLVSAHAQMKALHTEMEALHTSLGIEMKKDMKDMKDMKPENGDMKKDKAMDMPKEKRSLTAVSLKRADQKTMKTTIVGGTYEQFVAATPANHPILEYITKDNFSVLAQIAAAKKAGDSANVKTLISSLGISKKDAKVLRKIVK